MSWRRLAPIVVCGCLSVSGGCQKDPAIGEGETGTTETGTGETETETETESSDTDTETETETGAGFVPDDETETGEPEPEPKTCQQILDCVFECLGEGIGLECLQTCGEGFDPDEAQKAGDLVLCLGQQCIEKEQCSFNDFAAEECIGCIGLGLFLPEPPGCEEQAAACE